MISMNDNTDSTFTCWFENDTTTEYIIGTHYDKIDYPPLVFGEFDELHEQEIRAYHNNSTNIKTKQAVKFNGRKNNRQMNHNSGSFWHVQNN